MTKKIKTVIKLQIKGGQANPAPPVGTALGPHGLNIQDFVGKFNEATKDKMGEVVPVEVTVYEDRTFSLKFKVAPVSDMLRRAAKIEKGSGQAGKNIAGKVSRAEVRKIAEAKMPDLNADTVEAAMKIVEGTAKSMGIEITN